MFKAINTQDVQNTVNQIIINAGIKAESNRLWFKNPEIDYLVYKFPELNCYVGNDLVTPTLRIINCNDGKHAFRIMVGMVRFVCSNGLSGGDFLYTQRIIHVKGQTLDRKLAELGDRVAASLEYLATDFKEDVTESLNLRLTNDQSISIIGNMPGISNRVKQQAINHVFSPRRSEDMFVGNSVWGLWNNINESIKEKSKGLKAVKDNDNIINDILVLSDSMLDKAS